MSDRENRRQELCVFLLLLVSGAIVFAFCWFTVVNRTQEELATIQYSKREHFDMTWWLQHGYFHSAGLLVFPEPDGTPRLYLSSTGGYEVSNFVLQRIYTTIVGHPSWRLLTLHNQLVSLLVSTLLALLGFRLARRMGMQPLHAFAVALSLQAVYFTFPDNLYIYWEMTPRHWWLVFTLLFLLAGDDMPRVRVISAFLLMYMEYVAGAAFLMSYLLVALLFGERRESLRRLALIVLLPIIVTFGVFKTQRVVGQMLNPQMTSKGSTFLFRSGLDGSTQYYGDHLGIAYARGQARLNFGTETTRQLFFRWPWLFFTSTVATVLMLIAAARDKVPREAVTALVSLLGTYVIYGAVFSQSLVIHPYLYDMMLFAPLMLALFVLIPSLIEPMTRVKGLSVIVVLFLAIWVSMVHLRKYAIMYPQPEPPKKMGHGGRTVPLWSSDLGALSPKSPTARRRGAPFSFD